MTEFVLRDGREDGLQERILVLGQPDAVKFAYGSRNTGFDILVGGEWFRIKGSLDSYRKALDLADHNDGEA